MKKEQYAMNGKTIIIVEKNSGKTSEEQFENVVNFWVGILRRKDIQRGLIGENFEPLNGHLPAEENGRCWKYIAKMFVRILIKTCISEHIVSISEDTLFKFWLEFLQIVNNDIKCRNELAENFVNDSGISETTWIKFLD